MRVTWRATVFCGVALGWVVGGAYLLTQSGAQAAGEIGRVVTFGLKPKTFDLLVPQTVDRSHKESRLMTIISKHQVVRAESKKFDYYNGPSCSFLSNCEVAVQ